MYDLTPADLRMYEDILSTKFVAGSANHDAAAMLGGGMKVTRAMFAEKYPDDDPSALPKAVKILRQAGWAVRNGTLPDSREAWFQSVGPLQSIGVSGEDADPIGVFSALPAQAPEVTLRSLDRKTGACVVDVVGFGRLRGKIRIGDPDGAVLFGDNLRLMSVLMRGHSLSIIIASAINPIDTVEITRLAVQFN